MDQGDNAANGIRKLKTPGNIYHHTNQRKQERLAGTGNHFVANLRPDQILIKQFEVRRLKTLCQSLLDQIGRSGIGAQLETLSAESALRSHRRPPMHPGLPPLSASDYYQM